MDKVCKSFPGHSNTDCQRDYLLDDVINITSTSNQKIDDEGKDNIGKNASNDSFPTFTLHFSNHLPFRARMPSASVRIRINFNSLLYIIHPRELEKQVFSINILLKIKLLFFPGNYNLHINTVQLPDFVLSRQNSLALLLQFCHSLILCLNCVA